MLTKKRMNKLAVGVGIFSAVGLAVFAAGIYINGIQANSIGEEGRIAGLHFEKAIKLLKLENFQDAIVQYEKVVKLLPESRIAQDAQYWIGQSYFRMGEFKEALLVFEKLIGDFPGSAIVPVTNLMLTRVQKAMENQELKAKRAAVLDKKVIKEPKTGAEFRRTEVLAGKKDVAIYSSVTLSPNEKFLLHESIVIPLEGEEPFDLVDTEAWRGVWSPDGKKVVYYSGEAICVIPVSPETGRPTGPVRKLLDGRYRYLFPVSWAPDSERFVFMKLDEKAQGDIWTLSLKDGILNQITDDPGLEMNPVWSSDGKTIAYNLGDKEIHIISVNGGKSRKISDIDYGRYISWSPDGRWLLFKGATKPNLFLYRLADERKFGIESPKEVGNFFSWSSDGKKMFFFRTSYDFTNVLKVVSASGGPSFQLGRELKLSPYVQFWSPDSKAIIVSGIINNPDDSGKNFMIPLSGSDAISMKVDVSVKGKLHPLALSPDCERLLFSARESKEKENLYVIPVSLKEARTTGSPSLVFSEWECSHSHVNWAWSSNGNKLAVIHKGDVWAISDKNVKPVQLTKSSENEILPEWSPGGEKIAFVREEEQGKRTLHVISASGGESTKLLDNCAYWSHAWSPDGKELYAESKGLILAIPTDGGKAREIVDLKEQGVEGARGLCWLPDGKHLAFVSKKEGNRKPTRIFIVPAEGGRVRALATDDDDWKDWIYPSPDGKWISYNAEGYVKTRPGGTIWEVNVKELLK